MPETPPDAAAVKLRRSRAAAKPADRKSARVDGRSKATLLLSDSVDFRLTAIAASLKSDRSTLATQLLDAGLRRFALDAALRLHSGNELAAESERAGELPPPSSERPTGAISPKPRYPFSFLSPVPPMGAEGDAGKRGEAASAQASIRFHPPRNMG